MQSVHDGIQTQRNAGELQDTECFLFVDKGVGDIPVTFALFLWFQVNHLSKRHPEMRIDDVPELTLPIIKPNRDYFCQYCDKVRQTSASPQTLNLSFQSINESI